MGRGELDEGLVDRRNANGMFLDVLNSPIGELTIVASETALLKIAYDTPIERICANRITAECRRQLTEYFDGTRVAFDLRIRLRGTAFQERAWAALMKIPFGHTSTYGRQAAAVGRPEAARAVAAANGRNRINIVVPCHRVVGANGSLCGYSGGLDRKRWLLIHEGPRDA